MFKSFYPFEYVESVFAIDYKKLYSMGYRGTIFDIDNTLVHHGDDSNEKVDNLFRHVHNIGLKTILLSDNDRERIERFIKNIDTPYICDAKKPNVDNFLKAVDMLEMEKDKILYIGDQIFTDILGANKSGIDSVLVKYLRHSDETKIGKKRQLEKIILGFYKRNKSCRNRLGNITVEGN